MKDICCIGHITKDKIITPRKTVYMAGGTSFYFSYAFNHLPKDVTFQLVTKLGESEMESAEAMRRVGIDVLTFTAGVGENDCDVRAMVCDYLGFMGVKLDPELNKTRGKEMVISTPDSKVKVFVIPTNEELVIARDTRDIVG